MMTEAATSSPSSVRRRALKARRRVFDSGSNKVVADITASLSATTPVPVEPAGAARDTMARRWEPCRDRSIVTDQP